MFPDVKATTKMCLFGDVASQRRFEAGSEIDLCLLVRWVNEGKHRGRVVVMEGTPSPQTPFFLVEITTASI